MPRRVDKMLIRALIMCLVILAAASPAAFSQVTVAGIVRDDDTGQPVADARVEIFDFAGFKIAQRVTNGEGIFEHRFRRPGSYRFRVARIGYRSALTPMFSTGAHSYVEVEVSLKSDAVLLAPLTIVARDPRAPNPILDGFQARLRSGLAIFFTRDDLERVKPMRVSDLIVRVPGMHVASSGSGSQRHIFTGRSSRWGCPMQIWVDGFLLNPRGLGTSGLTLDEAVSPGNVEGIEIYRGLASVPAEFLNEDARCGVIAVWTRRSGRPAL